MFLQPGSSTPQPSSAVRTVAWQLSDSERNWLLYEWVRTASSKRIEALEARFEELWNPEGSIPEVEEFLHWPDWNQVPDHVPLERKNRQCLSE